MMQPPACVDKMQEPTFASSPEAQAVTDRLLALRLDAHEQEQARAVPKEHSRFYSVADADPATLPRLMEAFLQSKYIKSVCRVFLQRAVGSEVSTGFHWGNGWVGTNAHAILGTPHNRNRQWTNPNVDTAMITIEFPNIELSSGKPLRFEGHYRFAVIGDLPDSNGDDVAFIKIGHQIEYRQQAWPKWEEDEERCIHLIPALSDLNLMPDPLTGERPHGARRVHLRDTDDTLFALHFPVGSTTLQYSGPGRYTRSLEDHRFQHDVFTTFGSSGSPLFVIRGGLVMFAGVSAEGKPDDPAFNVALSGPLVQELWCELVTHFMNIQTTVVLRQAQSGQNQITLFLEGDRVAQLCTSYTSRIIDGEARNKQFTVLPPRFDVSLISP